MFRISGRRTHFIRFMLLAALPLSACTDEPATPASYEPASQADACALLTAAEIEAATGIAPGSPADMSQARLPMCNWPSADGSNPAFLTLMIGPSQNYTSYDEAMKKWAESAADMGFPFEANDYREVDDVGDVGAWMEEAGTLQAHTADTMIQVMVEVAPGRDRLEAARDLVQAVDARLP